MTTTQCGWPAYLLLLFALYGTTEEDTLSESDINQFNEEYSYMAWVRQSLEWQYSTNMSVRNADELLEFQETYSSWLVSWKTRARRTDTRRMDARHRRMIHLLSSGVVFTDPLISRKVSGLRTRLSRIYAEGYIDIPNLGIRHVKGEDGAEALMGTTRNPNLLTEIWRQWQSSVGRPVRSLFLELVTLLNQNARQNGYANYGEVWKEELDVDDVEREALRLWSEVEGFYGELRLYVQRRLHGLYGSSYLNSSGTIPVQLLGSLWGYNWKNLETLVLPFPEKASNSDGALVEDPTDLVKISEDFYSSLGFPSMTKSFWKKSMFTRPTDGRVVDCHGVAFDFQRDRDFRMKVCLSKGNIDELKTVFHEMGHVMYFMTYRHQPAIFRNSPNSVFHETIGDTVAMGALSPQCSGRVIGRENEELNYLMKQALTKVAILPWALTVDLWRYRVFEDGVNQTDLNAYWWSLRERFQGVKPPTQPDAEDFDPGTKYHVANFMPYMRYFFSHLLQFQLLEALCTSKSHNGLHNCCLKGDTNAGKKLWKMMSLGSSKPWSEVLHTVTGRRRMTASSLLRYFQPLYDWLKKANQMFPKSM